MVVGGGAAVVEEVDDLTGPGGERAAGEDPVDRLGG